MCFSDDLTKIHQHKETGAIYYEYGSRFYDSARRPLDAADVPKRFQLQLIGTESEDRLDKKICPWDAIRMYEFEGGLEASAYFYDPEKFKTIDGLDVIDAAEKKRLEEKQEEFYGG